MYKSVFEHFLWFLLLLLGGCGFGCVCVVVLGGNRFTSKHILESDV